MTNIRRYEIRSLKGEQVKSFEECEIANYLYLNGVNYEYERLYEHETASRRRGRIDPTSFCRMLVSGSNILESTPKARPPRMCHG